VVGNIWFAHDFGSLNLRRSEHHVASDGWLASRQAEAGTAVSFETASATWQWM
jgi:hypothetical protein